MKPNGYLILQSVSGIPSGTPFPNIKYNVGDILGDGLVVHSSAETYIVLTGLSSETTYYFSIYSYIEDGPKINYQLVSSPFTGSQITTIATPSAQPTNLVFTNILETQMDYSFDSASGITEYLGLIKASNAITGEPIDRIVYTVGDLLDDAIVFMNGESTSGTVTGLSSGIVYYFSIFSELGSGKVTNYLQENPLTGSRISTFASINDILGIANIKVFTDKDISGYTRIQIIKNSIIEGISNILPPPSPPSAIAFNNVYSNQMDILLTGSTASVDGYLVLNKIGSSITASPVNNIVYSVDEVLGDSTVIESATSVSTVSLTGLTNLSEQYFNCYDYKNGTYSSALTSSKIAKDYDSDREFSATGNFGLSLSSMTGFQSWYDSEDTIIDFKFQSRAHSGVFYLYSDFAIKHTYPSITSNNRWITVQPNGNYIYASSSANPARIIKVDADTMIQYGPALTASTGVASTVLTTVACDNNYLYYGSASGDAFQISITGNLQELYRVGLTGGNLGFGSNRMRACFIDNTRGYVHFVNNAGDIATLSTSSFTSTPTYFGDGNLFAPQCMEFDELNNMMYIPDNDIVGAINIEKIDLSTMTLAAYYTTTSLSSSNTMTQDSNYIYIGSSGINNGRRIVRIDKATLTQETTVMPTGGSGTNDLTSKIFIHDTDLYRITLKSGNGYFDKYDLNTFTWSLSGQGPVSTSFNARDYFVPNSLLMYRFATSNPRYLLAYTYTQSNSNFNNMNILSIVVITNSHSIELDTYTPRFAEVITVPNLDVVNADKYYNLKIIKNGNYLDFYFDGYKFHSNLSYPNRFLFDSSMANWIIIDSSSKIKDIKGAFAIPATKAYTNKMWKDESKTLESIDDGDSVLSIDTKNGTGWYGWDANQAITSSSGTTITNLVYATIPNSPSNLQFSNISGTGMDYSFDSISGTTGYIVLSLTSQIQGIPNNGNEYIVGDIIGDTTVFDSSTSTQGSLIGLNQDIDYYFKIYSKNGTGNQSVYSESPLTGSQRTISTALPLHQPTNLQFSNVTQTQMDLTFDGATGNVQGYIGLRKLGTSSITGRPQTGIVYNVGDTIGDATAIFIDSLTAHTVTGLVMDTDYSFAIFSSNGSGTGLIVYLQTNPLTGTQRSYLTPEPLNQPTNLQFSNVQTYQFDLSFTPATGNLDGYLGLMKYGSSSITANPIDGIGYSVGQTVGDAIVIFNDSLTAHTVTGLIDNTQHFTKIFSRNLTSISANYLTTIPLTGSQTTPVNSLASYFSLNMDEAQNQHLSLPNIDINSDWSISGKFYATGFYSSNNQQLFFTNKTTGYSRLYLIIQFFNTGTPANDLMFPIFVSSNGSRDVTVHNLNIYDSTKFLNHWISWGIKKTGTKLDITFSSLELGTYQFMNQVEIGTYNSGHDQTWIGDNSTYPPQLFGMKIKDISGTWQFPTLASSQRAYQDSGKTTLAANGQVVSVIEEVNGLGDIVTVAAGTKPISVIPPS